MENPYYILLMSVRVRFAPSPTGYLHVGGARTALFNWLFARHHGGKFILRIEDTDRERSTPEFDEDIRKGLKWLGLDWDEGPDVGGAHGPYRQRERLDRYRAAAEPLIQSGRMYKCFCSSEELDARREAALAKGLAPRYDGRCGRLKPDEVSSREQAGAPWVWRFRITPTGHTVVDDLIRGLVTFQNDLLDDLVVMKPDGMPTYNFAVVVDDHEMAITHVIRGEDHLSNTPRQWMIYQALGWAPPQCGHLPLILGADKTRLSKRHGATAVNAYEEQGVLPEALVNFLALLGWSLNDKDQVIPLQDLVKHFALERVSKSPAVFDTQKLEWMNGVYIRQLPMEELARRVWPRLVKRGWVTGEAGQGPSWDQVLGIVRLDQERWKYLSDVETNADFYFKPPESYDGVAEETLVKLPALKGSLKEYRAGTAETPFTAEALEAQARTFVGSRSLKLKDLAQVVRVALTGRPVSPPLFATMELLGKENCLARLDRAYQAWKA